MNSIVIVIFFMTILGRMSRAIPNGEETPPTTTAGVGDVTSERATDNTLVSQKNIVSDSPAPNLKTTKNSEDVKKKLPDGEETPLPTTAGVRDVTSESATDSTSVSPKNIVSDSPARTLKTKNNREDVKKKLPDGEETPLPTTGGVDITSESATYSTSASEKNFVSDSPAPTLKTSNKREDVKKKLPDGEETPPTTAGVRDVTSETATDSTSVSAKNVVSDTPATSPKTTKKSEDVKKQEDVSGVRSFRSQILCNMFDIFC